MLIVGCDSVLSCPNTKCVVQWQYISLPIHLFNWVSGPIQWIEIHEPIEFNPPVKPSKLILMTRADLDGHWDGMGLESPGD